MSPMLENMLIHKIVPRLRSAARSIPKIGCEDDEEIIQDCTLQAARMMDSAEKAGQKFTAGNMAYYAARMSFVACSMERVRAGNPTYECRASGTRVT